jgi:hypothetical protein
MSTAVLRAQSLDDRKPFVFSIPWPARIDKELVESALAIDFIGETRNVVLWIALPAVGSAQDGGATTSAALLAVTARVSHSDSTAGSEQAAMRCSISSGTAMPRVLSTRRISAPGLSWIRSYVG